MMENDELSLDPDYYEHIYVCHICCGVSTEPVCGNNHVPDDLSIDFENLIQPTILSANNQLVTAKEDKQKDKICAVIPPFSTNQQTLNQDYLCPTCGDISTDIECKKNHDIQTLKDVCSVCETEFSSINEMIQHDKCCQPFNRSCVDSVMSLVSLCNADQINSVVKPFAIYLPENFASMVQKGSLGTGQYQVVAVDTNSLQDEVMNTLSASDFGLAQNIMEWDESMDLAVLDIDDSTFEVLGNEESLFEPNIAVAYSAQLQIESPKHGQISSTSARKELKERKHIENRRQLRCVICEIELLDVDALVAHYLTHGSSTFICQFCLRHYSRSHWFKVHMKTHAHEMAIVCALCDDLFLSTKLHAEHLETVHNLYVAETERKLLDHQKNPFMCMECGRWLKSEKHLESHRRMHEMGRSAKLEHPMTTTDKSICSGGKNTIKLACMESTTTTVLNQGKKKPIHIFECNICSATIKSIEEIRQHMMSHDAHQHFKCEACNQQFQTAAQMDQHKCIKHAANLNTCTDCSKVFSHPAGLPYHLKADHQVEAISCDKCQLKFKMLGTYLIHRARHH